MTGNSPLEYEKEIMKKDDIKKDTQAPADSESKMIKANFAINMAKSQIIETILNFHCPRYEEIPDIELYLDQVLNFVNSSLAPIGCEPLTGAMISNYVKNKAVPAPIKKKYTRDHIAYMIVTTLLKQVFTLQHIAKFFEVQRETYPLEVAYNYFCNEYENALDASFRFTGEAMPRIETALTDQTILVRAVVLSAANRVYAEKLYFS